MSSRARIFRQLLAEPSTGPIEPHGDSVLGTPEHLGRVPVREALPGDETEQLLVVSLQAAQCVEHGPLLVACDHANVNLCFPRRDLLGQASAEISSAVTGPALVGDHAPGHSEQPRQRLVAAGDRIQSSPGSEEGLRDDLVSVRTRDGPTTSVGKHRPVMDLVDPSEPPFALRAPRVSNYHSESPWSWPLRRIAPPKS